MSGCSGPSACSLIAMARTPASSGGGVQGILDQFAEGLRFLVKHRALLFVTLAFVAAVFALGAFDALAAVYVRDILHAQAQTFGVIISLVGVGMILGALVIGKFGQKQSKVSLVVAGILGLGLGVFVLAATSRVALALGTGVWLGVAASMVLVPSQTLVQQETPQTILGRVSSTSSSVITVSQLVSVAVAGKVANWIGIRNLYYAVASALILIACSGFMYAKIRRVAETKPVG